MCIIGKFASAFTQRTQVARATSSIVKEWAPELVEVGRHRRHRRLWPDVGLFGAFGAAAQSWRNLEVIALTDPSGEARQHVSKEVSTAVSRIGDLSFVVFKVCMGWQEFGFGLLLWY